MNERQFRTGEGVEHGGFDYMAEADKTCSIVFNPQFVNTGDFIACLRTIVLFSNELNTFKKLLFRGKTPGDVGMLMPAHDISLAEHFDASDEDGINVLHGIVGAITETGEMAECLLHRLATDKFDRVNVAEEAGDVLWYLARQLRGLKTNFDNIGRMNIDKLHGRHGEAFDVFRDANRDLSTERQRLEEAAPLFEQHFTDAPALGTGSDALDLGQFAAGNGPVSDHPGFRDADAPIPPERAMRGALPANVGTRGPRVDPPGVERFTKTPRGDVEGMDC